MWGIFPDEETSTIHVIPADKSGKPLKPHVVDVFCPCHPESEITENSGLIVIHNEVH